MEQRVEVAKPIPKKEQIRPANHQISGGLMTAGIKPGELPSGALLEADPNANPNKKKPEQPSPAASVPTPTPVVNNAEVTE